MRIFPAFAIMASLAATPCMAQLVITNGDPNAAARHEEHADHQEHAAQRDAAHARADASVGDYGAAAHEQADANHHAAAAQNQQYRADQSTSGGVTVQVR